MISSGKSRMVVPLKQSRFAITHPAVVFCRDSESRERVLEQRIHSEKASNESLKAELGSGMSAEFLFWRKP
jgi:hypothetical protein